MELGKRGANRQDMHEVIREESLKAWAIVQQGGENPLLGYLLDNDEIKKYLTSDEVRELMDASHYTGDAEARCDLVLRRVQDLL